MLKYALFPVLSLAACAEDKAEDTASDISEDISITFGMTFVDGVTSAALEGADVCIEEPAVADNCFVTDDDGYVEWVWATPETTNFLGRLDMEGYPTNLYAGRYNDDIAENWASQLEETGKIQLNYGAFSDASVDLFMNSADAEVSEDHGHVLLFLGQSDGSGLEGSTVSVTDAAGDAVGTVYYVNSTMTGMDTELASTSSSGGVGIVNVVPGVHTVTVSSPDHVCQAGFSWNSDVDNEVPVPVEAGAMTQAAMTCAPAP